MAARLERSRRYGARKERTCRRIIDRRVGREGGIQNKQSFERGQGSDACFGEGTWTSSSVSQSHRVGVKQVSLVPRAVSPAHFDPVGS